MSALRSTQISAINSMVQATYPAPDFGFHSWATHIPNVLDAGYLIGDRLRRNRISYNVDAFRVAAMLHDAGIGILPADFIVRDKNGTCRPATCAEEVSMAIGRSMMERVGFEGDFIAEVLEAIDGTRAMARPRTTVAKLLAAADLYRVGFGDFPEFLSNTRLLHKEVQRLQGKTISFPQFFRGSMSYLGLYTARELRITKQYLFRGRSAWHVGALRHICRAVRSQLQEQKPLIVAEIGEGPFSITTIGETPLLNDVSLHITVAADDEHRVLSMQWIRNCANDLTIPPPMTVAAPQEGMQLSLPSHVVDRVLMLLNKLHYYMMSGFSPHELRRIIARGGELHITDTQVGSNRLYANMLPDYHRAINDWLGSAGFSCVGEADQPYGSAMVYRP